MVTPPIEENVVRVSISNELVESVLNDEELQGLLPIPNDDIDYADYVEAITEGGSIEGPFTTVQLDFTQLTPQESFIDLYTRYSYISVDRYHNRTNENAILLNNTIFTIRETTGTVSVPKNKALIRIAPYDENGYFFVSYIVNQSSDSLIINIAGSTRYAFVDLPSGHVYPYFHYCATTDNDDLGEFIFMDPANQDNNSTISYIKNTVYRLYVRTE